MIKNQLFVMALNEMRSVLIAGSVVLLLLILLLTVFSKKIVKKKSNMTMLGYQIIYTDQKETDKLIDVDYGIILYSSRYNIQGKPDYIFKKNMSRRLVPVEIKSGTIGKELLPHNGDLYQLAAYFLIIEDVYKVKPKYGKLIYKDYMFIIKNTMKLRRELKMILARMRIMLEMGEDNNEKANPSFPTCRYCICNGTVCEYCEQKPRRGRYKR